MKKTSKFLSQASLQNKYNAEEAIKQNQEQYDQC